MTAKKVYAVKVGRNTGIFTTWNACKEQVQGYSGAVYKSFVDRSEAEQYLCGEAVSVIAEETIEQFLQKGEMVAYVDGSFLQKEHRFSYGAVLFYKGKEFRKNGSDDDPVLAEMRNVAGEIRGAETAIAFALEQQAPGIHIYHDYAGIAYWCTGEWQAKKEGTQSYRDYYRDAIQKGLKIYFHKVKGHSGDQYNELADQLAKEALGINH